MTRQIEVDVVGNASKLNTALDSATEKSSKFGDAVKGFGLGVGLAAFGALTGGISSVQDALGKADEAFKDDQVSQAALGTALKNNVPNFNGNTSAIENAIAANDKFGFSVDDQRSSLALLVGVTKNVGDAQNAQAAAMDLARLKGISLGDATNIIIKAEEGRTTGLKALGIEVQKGADASQVLADVEKVAGGQAAAYAETSDGKLAASQTKVNEAMVKVGAVLDQVSQVALPILADALSNGIEMFQKMYTQVQPFIEQLAKNLAPTIKQIGDVAATVFPYIVTAVQTLIGVWQTEISIFITVAQKVIDIMNSIWTTVKPVVANIINAVTSLVTFFSGVPDKISSAVSGMWNGIWDGFRSVIDDIIRGWNSLQFSVPSVDLGPLGKVGGFSIGVPQIPLLHSGGIVPGPTGADVLTMLQAGERVIPVSQANKATGNTYITINATGLTDDALARKIVYPLKKELLRQGVSFA